MKRIIVLIMITCLFGCNSKFQKVAEKDVDIAKVKRAEAVASKILESQKAGRFDPLGDEATIAMQNGLTPEIMKEGYEMISGMFGDYKGMEYKEAWVPKDGTFLTIYRFMGHFETPNRPEIRVVMDKNEKLAGLWVKPWRKEIR